MLGHPVAAKNVPFVASDNKAGIETLMKHLLEQGHQRIAYIARSDDPENNAARFKAYKQALKKLNCLFMLTTLSRHRLVRTVA